MHRRLPVTLIGGFLGAGKTSLLHHLITEHQGGHLALLVESPSALNPDAKALRGLCRAMGRAYDAVEEIPPDGEAEAMAKKLQDLAQAGRYERVLVEVSGTTDAARLARHFGISGDESNLFGAWAELEQVVCVVDLLDFHRAFVVPEAGSDALRDFRRGQIESASLIVLNKCDLAGDDERRQSTRLLRRMNADAQIVETAYGEILAEKILGPAPTLALRHALDFKSGGERSSPSLESVVYRAHRPFHPGRFWEWFKSPHPGLFRVKGLVWLATRNLLVGGISRTAWQNGCGAAGIWWAALPREEWPADPQILEKMQTDWREPYGDRRQELVLIGESGPAGTAARQLNGCLLIAEEYARPTEEWIQMADPFPAWDLEE
jgi:G3E family GTPase